jgi:hypothetical protein
VFYLKRSIKIIFAAAYVTLSLAAKGDSQSFDTGMDITFNAEDNENIAFETNPACVTYFETHTVLTNFGGDMSFGEFEFSANEGSADPDSMPGEGEAVSISHTLGTSVKAISVFRLGKNFVAGLGGGYDYNGIRLGYNGQGLPLIPYYSLDRGLSDLEVSSKAYNGVGVIALEFGKTSIGGSFEYYNGEDDFEVSQTYYNTGEIQGVRRLNNMIARVGVQYRSNNLTIGFAPGYAKLKNEVKWDDVTVWNDGSSSRERTYYIDGNGFFAETDAKFRLANNFGLGFGFGGHFVPKVTADYEKISYDHGVPTSYGASNLGEGKEYILKAKTGFAFYPDDKTTLAFDYNADFYKASFDLWNEYGYTTDTYDLSSRVTYTQLGAERWITEDLEAKLGWRQNVYTLPRNVLFAGVLYNVTDSVGLAYDYMGEHVGINDFSLFTPLGELVHSGSHKLTLTFIL